MWKNRNEEVVARTTNTGTASQKHMASLGKKKEQQRWNKRSRSGDETEKD